MSKPNEELIFDRTLSDIINRTAKGYYNLSDLQRIQSWIAYLSEELDLNLSTYNFILGERLTRARLEAIINNIQTIINVFYEGHSTTPPNLPWGIAWDITKANDIEHILSLANDFLEASKNDSLIANTFYSGEFPVLRYKDPAKLQTHTVRLVSISGNQTKDYTLEVGSFFRIPEYKTLFSGDFYEWRAEDNQTTLIDKGVFFVPTVGGMSILRAYN